MTDCRSDCRLSADTSTTSLCCVRQPRLKLPRHGRTNGLLCWRRWDCSALDVFSRGPAYWAEMLRVSETGLLLPEKADRGAEVPVCQFGAINRHNQLLFDHLVGAQQN